MLIRIVLDTCTVRNHIHTIGTELDFKAIANSQDILRFSIAGAACAELLEDLTDGSVSFQEWTKEIPRIDAILDDRWPALPSGRQLAALAGTQTDISIDAENERRHLWACWRLMRLSKSLSDLQAGGRYKATDGKEYGIKLEVPKLDSVVSGERTSWITYIQQMQALLPKHGIGKKDEATILALMKQNQGSYPGDPPDLADRLDSVARTIAKLVADSLANKTPYDPSTDRRIGDAFDISLLFYVPLPAVICTADKKFVSRLKHVKAVHAQQVVTIEEFNQHVNGGTLKDLVKDFRTPEDQHRRWREAAYFLWIERGRRIGHDVEDWHDAEPIA